MSELKSMKVLFILLIGAIFSLAIFLMNEHPWWYYLISGLLFPIITWICIDYSFKKYKEHGDNKN